MKSLKPAGFRINSFLNNINVKLVFRDKIDVKKWDAEVTSSDVQNPLIYSWALDATCEWCAVIKEDYSFIFPIPFVKRFGVQRALQQAYSRQMDYIGSSEDFLSAIELIKKEFAECELRLTDADPGIADQKFQFLDFNLDYKYKSNAVRLIKRASKLFTYETSGNYKPLLKLYSKNSFKKFHQPKSNLLKLDNLMLRMIERKKGIVINAMHQGELVGSLFLIQDKSTMYYLIGDSNPNSKKDGVMFGLMNDAINLAKEKGLSRFDFGGSNVDSVAQFYKKFGAVDQFYTRITWNNLPFWFKILKRLKKS